MMSSIVLSVMIAAGATLCVSLIAVPLAHWTARSQFRGKNALETLLILPLVLPPTVVGYVLIMLFGARGLLGQWLFAWFGYSIMFRVEGAMLAAAIVAFPLMYLPAKAAFRTISSELEDTAQVLGATHRQVFWWVSLPLARRGVLSGMVLCSARALGEFGATIMVFGWRPGRLTMPIAIYSAYEQGHAEKALPIVLVITAICFLMLLLYDREGRLATR